MSKPSIRQAILLRSVQRLLPDDEHVRSVVMMMHRHRWFLPFAIGGGALVYAVAVASGIQGSFNQVVVGACGIAVAALATTEHRVLAETTQGLVLLRSSRIRQYATAVVGRLPSEADVTMVASTVVTSDWRVDGVIYTLTKRWEATMRHLAATRT